MSDDCTERHIADLREQRDTLLDAIELIAEVAAGEEEWWSKGVADETLDFIRARGVGERAVYKHRKTLSRLKDEKGEN